MKKEKEATAAVLMEPEVVETRVFPLPDIGDDDALLRLEACGMCGTDYELYYGHIKPRPDADGRPGYPVILGHEPVGTIEEIGPEASRLWGVEAGDRVVLGATGGLGLTGISTPPSLWGGYAEFMYVSPSARVFPMSKHVSVRAQLPGQVELVAVAGQARETHEGGARFASRQETGEAPLSRHQDYDALPRL